jgi:spermidine synthase
MTPQSHQSLTCLVAARSFLPVLLLLFAGSGCSALVYEIVWLQLLQLVIGSSAISLAVLLGTFMGGMCLGSLLLPRILSPRFHPLRVYAALEVGIGIIGLVVLFGMPSLGRFYMSMVGSGWTGIMLRGVVCGLCLLPPTMLMGATLPAIARIVPQQEFENKLDAPGVSWLGLFYGGNIAGAVFGCLLAGFYLLRVYDMATGVYFAATLNAIVALIALGIAAATPYVPEERRGEGARGRGSDEEGENSGGLQVESKAVHCSPSRPLPPSPVLSSWPVYVAIALSGAGALAAEVIWTRLLSLLLGGTVYTFSIILAVFLAGLGLGSAVGSTLARRSTRPRVLLGGCQWLLAAAIAWTAYMLAHSLPYWPINPSLSSSPWLNFQLDLVRCLWAILPATFLWGASFPLALAAVAEPGQDPGRLVGGVYAANTIGAIVGALAASLLLIQWLGTQHGQRLLIGLSLISAMLLLAPLLWPFRQIDTSQGISKKASLKIVGVLTLLAAVGVPGFLAWAISESPWELVAFGRYLLTYQNQWSRLYVGEGMNSSVAVTEVGDVRNFHVSGKVEASTDPTDMRVQRMLGHIPALLHPRPRSVLVVGCGAGVTAGSFVTYPDIERIVICEIEPLVPQVVASYFAKENYDVVHDPRVEIVFDDARHYILTTREKFDIITSDPIHPWVKGSATLYTKEYFELCQEHLNPNGLITQWVPLYETTGEVVKSEIATFFDIFPQGTIWANSKDGQGYDLMLLGQVEPTKINVDELQGRLEQSDRAAVAKSLDDVGFSGTVSLFKTYAGRASNLQAWLARAEINRDSNLRLQYLAGMGLHVNQSKSIYDEITSYRRFPEDVFVGSGMRNTALRWALESQNSVQ